MSGTIACPICRRRSWLTADGLAHHLENDHARAVVAETLAQLVTAPPVDPALIVPTLPPAVEIKPDGCPSSKRRFATEHEARCELVSAVIGRNRGKKERRESRVYLCPRCDGWHLTSMAEPPAAVSA